MTLFKSGFRVIEHAIEDQSWLSNNRIKVTSLRGQAGGRSADIILLVSELYDKRETGMPSLYFVEPQKASLAVPYVSPTKEQTLPLDGPPELYAKLELKGWETVDQVRERIIELWHAAIETAWLNAHLGLKAAERDLAVRKYDLALIAALQKTLK